MKKPISYIDRMEIFEHCVTLYPVVSSEFCAGRSALEVIRQLGEGGAVIFQLREKHLSDRELYTLGCEARKIADEYSMLFMLDDRLDVAMACNADGVHLGQDDLPVEAARKIAPEMIVGVSTHNIPEAQAACRGKCSYLNIGPIYPTNTKSVACGALGLEALKTIPQVIDCPFTVMGGIKAKHIPELTSAGAQRIAMVTEITQAEDIAGKVRELLKLF
ncbi:MAG: thiamine phosphate synthase [Lentisphaerae bacterium]|nr:thiamine phosphate synthase [Lentisphaerota bacterium]